MNFERRLFRIVERLYAPPGVAVNSDTGLFLHLGFDDHKLLDFIREVEAEFNTQIPDSVLGCFTTLGCVLEWLRRTKYIS